MTAVELRSFFILRATPSRIALAILVKRALPASKRISPAVAPGAGAGGGGAGASGTTSSTWGAGGGTMTRGGGGGGQGAYVMPITPAAGAGPHPTSAISSKFRFTAAEIATPECPSQKRPPR